MSNPDLNYPLSSDLIHPEPTPFRIHGDNGEITEYRPCGNGAYRRVTTLPARRALKPFRSGFIAGQWDRDAEAITRQSRLLESMEAARHRRSTRICNIIAATAATGAVLALIVAVISTLAV